MWKGEGGESCDAFMRVRGRGVKAKYGLACWCGGLGISGTRLQICPVDDDGEVGVAVVVVVAWYVWREGECVSPAFHIQTRPTPQIWARGRTKQNASPTSCGKRNRRA